MPDRVLEVPAPEGFEQYGWTCIYHRGVCHNPSDCDYAPLFLPTSETRRQGDWRRWHDLTDEEQDDMLARKRAL